MKLFFFMAGLLFTFNAQATELSTSADVCPDLNGKFQANPSPQNPSGVLQVLFHDKIAYAFTEGSQQYTFLDYGGFSPAIDTHNMSNARVRTYCEPKYPSGQRLVIETKGYKDFVFYQYFNYYMLDQNGNLATGHMELREAEFNGSSYGTFKRLAP